VDNFVDKTLQQAPGVVDRSAERCLAQKNGT